jgi:HK97 gp10 family phage protein
VSDIQKQAAQVAAAFKAKGIELESSLSVAMNAAGLFVAGKAKSDGYAPIDTGLLRNSITNRVRKLKGAVTGEVGTNTEYAAFQEFGTSKMPAANGGRGYLRVALDDSKNTVQAIITAYLKRNL